VLRLEPLVFLDHLLVTVFIECNLSRAARSFLRFSILAAILASSASFCCTADSACLRSCICLSSNGSLLLWASSLLVSALMSLSSPAIELDSSATWLSADCALGELPDQQLVRPAPSAPLTKLGICVTTCHSGAPQASSYLGCGVSSFDTLAFSSPSLTEAWEP